jgi:diaminohydroxyphosphoribosylaminopyrimidine deaminase/5-amino-6-(5-phosphoribosylamino)uracil reductase
VEVAVGVERDACESLILGFARSVVQGLPEVTLKAAISVDGRIATAAGESQWITGEAARSFGHGLRAEHDAIVVGIGTVLADDPRLTCRTRSGADPVPVVFDSALRISVETAIFRHPRRPIVICGEHAPVRDLPAEILRLPGSRPAVEDALRALAQRGLHRVIVEGGAALHRSFLDSGLVDAVELFIAPLAIPGGRPWLGGSDLARLGDAPRWGAPEVLRLGDDVRLRYAVPHRLGFPFVSPANVPPES